MCTGSPSSRPAAGTRGSVHAAALAGGRQGYERCLFLAGPAPGGEGLRDGGGGFTPLRRDGKKREAERGRPLKYTSSLLEDASMEVLCPDRATIFKANQDGASSSSQEVWGGLIYVCSADRKILPGERERGEHWDGAARFFTVAVNLFVFFDRLNRPNDKNLNIFICGARLAAGSAGSINVSFPPVPPQNTNPTCQMNTNPGEHTWHTHRQTFPKKRTPSLKQYNPPKPQPSKRLPLFQNVGTTLFSPTPVRRSNHSLSYTPPNPNSYPAQSNSRCCSTPTLIASSRSFFMAATLSVLKSPISRA